MINIKAFTFIEIMVSISILSIMAIVGIGSFQKFFTTQQITRIQEKIINIKRGLDTDIEAGNISSYSLAFASGSNCIVANIDYLNSAQIIRFNSFDYTALSGALITNNTSTGLWETKIYVDNVFSKSFLNNGSGSSNDIDLGGYSGFETIKITSTISKLPTNNFIFYRLDYTKDEGENIENTYITSLSGSTAYDEIYLINEMGKKRLDTQNGATSGNAQSADVGLTRISSELTFTIKP